MVYRNGEALITTVQIQSINLTWDEYQNLPPSKLTDGVYYNITDWEQSTLDIVNTLTGENIALQSRIAELENANTYSEEEVRIGIWVDGKPLYRRVVSGLSATISSNTWTNLFTATKNEETITRAFGITSAGLVQFCETSIYNGYVRFIPFLNSNRTIYSVVIEYTKTTD